MRGALWDEISNSCELERFWLKLNSDGLDPIPAPPYIYLPSTTISEYLIPTCPNYEETVR